MCQYLWKHALKKLELLGHSRYAYQVAKKTCIESMDASTVILLCVNELENFKPVQSHKRNWEVY